VCRGLPHPLPKDCSYVCYKAIKGSHSEKRRGMPIRGTNHERTRCFSYENDTTGLIRPIFNLRPIKVSLPAKRVNFLKHPVQSAVFLFCEESTILNLRKSNLLVIRSCFGQIQKFGRHVGSPVVRHIRLTMIPEQVHRIFCV
jgi:hypothetical protein